MGVLDVGSNTVHLLLVDAHYGAAPIPASKHKAPLRLAEHTDADGVIDQELIDRSKRCCVALEQSSQPSLVRCKAASILCPSYTVARRSCVQYYCSPSLLVHP